MKKNVKKIVVAVLLGCMLTGCGANDSDAQTTEEGQADGAAAGEIIVEDVGDVVEDVADVVMEPLDLIPGMPDTVTTQASESDRHPELESLIQSRYEIGDDALAGTRYYYNTMDLNADGTDEMVAVVMGDGINDSQAAGGTGTTGGGTESGTDGAGSTGTESGTGGTGSTGTGSGTEGAGTTGSGTESGTGSTGGSATGGTGAATGESSTGNLLVLTNTEGTWQIMQEFEGIGGPVIVSDTVTNGYRDLIVMNNNTDGGTGTGSGTGAGSGTGTGNGGAGNSTTGEEANTEDVMPISEDEGEAGSAISGTPRGGSGSIFLRLVYEEGQYSEIETAEVLDSIDSITGTALLYNDVQGDFESGDYMSLGSE